MIKDLINQKFGRLRVIKKIGRIKGGHMLYLCHCDCGNEKIIQGNNLLHKNSTSCGCKHKEFVKDKNPFFRHGHSINGTVTPTYVSWASMMQRCTSPQTKDIKLYLERGITVCDAWKDFRNFLFDMGEGPLGKALDRINNDLGYCLDNCRWATPKEQVNNRRKK